MLFTVRAEGTDKLARALHRARAGMAQLDLSGVGRDGVRLAVSFAPRRTGRLAATIRVQVGGNRVSISAGSTAVPYAAAINYGWRKHGIEPTNYMERADSILRGTAPRKLDQLAHRELARHQLV